MTALESEITLQEKKIAAAFEGLRAKKFEQGLPFLILSDELPEGQAYREYANGKMEVQEVYEEDFALKSKIVRLVAETEAARVRLIHGLH